MGTVDLLAGAKSSLLHRAGFNILQFGAHKRRALTWLHMLKINNLVDGPIHLNGHAGTKFARGNHLFILLNRLDNDSYPKVVSSFGKLLKLR